MRLPAAVLGLLLVRAFAPGQGHAQADDDWSLTRERSPAGASKARSESKQAPAGRPRETSGEALLRAALAHPGDELAFERLRASELRRAGTLEELVAQLRAARDRSLHDEKPRQLLARVLASAGRPDEALAELGRALEEAGHPTTTRTLQGELLREFGRSAEAAAVLEILAAGPGTRLTRAARWREAAREHLRAGQSAAALAMLARARALGGAGLSEELSALELEAHRRAGTLAALAQQLEQRAAWLEAARTWQEQGDDARALAAFQRWLAQRPADLAARAQCARLLVKLGRLGDAEREAEAVVRRAPRELEPVLLLAELRHAAGRREQALSLLAASSRRFVDAASHRALRELYVRWNEPVLADRELRILAALEPREPAHRIALAEQALAHGERAAAVALLRGKPTDVRTASDEAALAGRLAERDLLPEAIEHIERARALAPRELAYRRSLASLLERSGRTLAAEPLWQELMQATNAERALRREARLHLVGLWGRAGTLPSHVAALRVQASAGELDAAQTLLLAELYGRDPQQRPAQIQLLEGWLARTPTDLDALLLLAQAQGQQGDRRAALQSWSRVLGTGGAEAAAQTRAALELALQNSSEAQAVALVEQARALALQDARLMRLVGAFYRARAERGLARAAYERAVDLDPREYAAHFALAEDALLRGDEERARTLLRAIVLDADDEVLVTEAAKLLLQRSVEAGEGVLLEASRTAGGQSVQRRLLFEHWASSVLPQADDMRDENVDRPAEERVERTVRGAIGLLLEALLAGSPAQRAVALGLLEVAPHEAALLPLLAVAEQPERALGERAHALLAIGRLRTPSAAARLAVLSGNVARQLRPLVLWALCESGSEHAAAPLRAAMVDRASELRALSAVLMVYVPALWGKEQLTSLQADADARVRAAASWASAQLESGPGEGAIAALDTAPPAGLLALAAGAGRPEPLAIGLFAADERVRTLAASYLLGKIASAERAPVPAWPFVLDAYLERVAHGRAVRVPETSLRAESGRAIARAAVARLTADRTSVERALAELSPYAGGLLPRALLVQAQCGLAPLARELGRALEDRLAELVSGPDQGLGALAFDRLVQGGGAGRPEVAVALSRAGGRGATAMLRALAALPSLPDSLRPTVNRLVHESPRWPVRMWAARALHVGTAPRTDEPVALVRALASVPVRPGTGDPSGCSAADPVTN